MEGSMLAWFTAKSAASEISKQRVLPHRSVRTFLGYTPLTVFRKRER